MNYHNFHINNNECYYLILQIIKVFILFTNNLLFIINLMTMEAIFHFHNNDDHCNLFANKNENNYNDVDIVNKK